MLDDIFLSWFVDSPPVLQSAAKIVFAELKKVPFNPLNSVTEINLVDDSSTPPPQKKSKSTDNKLPKHNTESYSLNSRHGFVVTRTKEGTAKLREQRKEEAKKRKAAGVTEVFSSSSSSDDDDDDDDDDVVDMTEDVERGSNKAAPTKSLLALPESKWNLHRCAITNELDPPADEYEKKCWAHENNLLPKDKRCPDLEDPKGLYRLFGCNIRSSDKDIKAAFSAKKKEFHDLSRTHHPDKAGGNEEKINIFREAKTEYEALEAAYHILHGVNDEGIFQERFDYDKSGQDLRHKFLEEFSKRHPSLSFAQRAAQIAQAEKERESYAKGHQTKAALKEKDVVSQIVHAYNCNGHQTNELRLLVAKALQQGNTQAELVRDIRRRASEYAKISWDGKVSTCKIAKQIKSVIGRIVKNLQEGSLDPRMTRCKRQMETFSRLVHFKTFMPWCLRKRM